MFRNCITFCLEYLELGALDWLIYLKGSSFVIRFDINWLSSIGTGKGLQENMKASLGEISVLPLPIFICSWYEPMQAKYNESAVFCEVINTSYRGWADEICGLSMSLRQNKAIGSSSL